MGSLYSRARLGKVLGRHSRFNEGSLGVSRQSYRQNSLQDASSDALCMGFNRVD
jgi:hypothetical protein